MAKARRAKRTSKAKSATKVKRKKARRWTERLDPSAVREALQEASIDAYDEYEQHAGLLTMIEDQLEFPFRAEVLGEEVQVVGMDWPEDDEFGLDLVIERGRKRHRIEARSVQLLEPFPEGHLYLAAYLYWKRHL
ncbi:MAG TPA: hypothetical protein EYP56_09255 [Planctomycetaceae bacterium]|nr:hypothetical protein [Planctomycetaceae bacterium]HIQ20235.1 hypothetical protein [Planctomycetota bacterium]